MASASATHWQPLVSILATTNMVEDFEDDFLPMVDNGLEANEEMLYFNLPSFASKYVTDCKLHDFFNFEDHTALNILHVNCRSLKKNFNSLTNLLNMVKYPISAIAVTETWLSDPLRDVYSIPGYNFISHPRIGKSGGGVGIYLNNSFVYKCRLDLYRMLDHIECLFVEIQRPNMQPIFIGCIYRPPNTDINNFNSDMQLIMGTIDNVANKIAVIAGDFNLNFLKHASHAPTADFLNLLLSYNFLPTICQPTRITEFSSTLIDNILSTVKSLIITMSLFTVISVITCM